MNSLFLWEIGSPRVYLIWLFVFLTQMAIAEINRRWTWTIFLIWTVGGLAMIPYAINYAIPILGWFPFGKYCLMIFTATVNGCIVVLGKYRPDLAHRYVVWIGVFCLICLGGNILEANIRDITIYNHAADYYACAADWHCLATIDQTHSNVDLLSRLPEARGITADPKTDAWYMALAANFDARHIGIDPATGFRTIGGYWNLLSAAAGFLNILTITGLTRIIVAGRKDTKVKSIVWLDQIWPWIIAYDLWNHAFLYNSLGDYTWYCTLALLLACTIPAFTWARGQWIWFRCYTLMYWIAFYNWLPTIATPPNAMTNFATMNPTANKVCSWIALLFNIGVFIYWLYRSIKLRRNPFTEALFLETKAFRRVVTETCNDKEKYFITDCVKSTPTELGFAPDKPKPPIDGYITHYFWWGKKDKRYPKLRTPLSAQPALVKKGIQSDPQWDVTASDTTPTPNSAATPSTGKE